MGRKRSREGRACAHRGALPLRRGQRLCAAHMGQADMRNPTDAVPEFLASPCCAACGASDGMSLDYSVNVWAADDWWRGEFAWEDAGACGAATVEPSCYCDDCWRAWGQAS